MKKLIDWRGQIKFQFPFKMGSQYILNVRFFFYIFKNVDD